MSTPAPFRFNVTKVYPQRGPLQQYRTTDQTAFVCFRCGQAKTSKLIALVDGVEGQMICNGCYGYLVSLWDIRRDDAEDASRDNMIVSTLASAVTRSTIEQSRALLLARDSRASLLSPEAQTTLATAEAVQERLVSWSATALDWSAAIVCLCKTVEIEVIRLIAEPLRTTTSNLDLSSESANPDLRKMVKYCQGHGVIELGALAFFLKAATGGRASQGVLAQSLRSVSRTWPRSDWLFDAHGLPLSLTALAKDFRNRAAHTEILNVDAYGDCAELVTGPEGLLWKLLLSAQPRRK